MTKETTREQFDDAIAQVGELCELCWPEIKGMLGSKLKAYADQQDELVRELKSSLEIERTAYKKRIEELEKILETKLKDIVDKVFGQGFYEGQP